MPDTVMWNGDNTKNIITVINELFMCSLLTFTN